VRSGSQTPCSVAQSSIRTVRVGCHFRIDVLSPTLDRSYWSCEELLRSTPSKPILPGARPIPVSRISDSLIEAGGCPDRSGLRRFSVVLVNQATQEVPTSDRVVDGERRDVFLSLRRQKVEAAMGSLAVVVLNVRLQH